MSEKLVRKFYGRSTAAEVLAKENVKGKRFLVTGGTSGIGTATVEALAQAGGHVVFTGRNNDGGNNLVHSIIKNHPGAIVEYMPLDMNSLKSVKKFGEDFIAKYKRLEVLIFNAGMFGGSYTETEDGYESAAQVNAISQVYLLELLRPLLMKSTPARVVFVSSDAHRSANLKSDHFSLDILSPSKQQYSSWRQYANTKLCQILIANYLQDHWSKDGMTFYSLHPGHMISTGIGRSWTGARVLFAITSLFTKSLQQGASTTIYCAASSDVADQGGQYWRDCWTCEPTAPAKDKALAEAVWKTCQKMIADKMPDYTASAE